MSEPKTPEEHKTALHAQLRRDGGVLPQAPDGPLLDCFKAAELAQAIEYELQRTAERGGTRIRLDMHLTDAQDLASYLRRAVLAGV